jgi:hypothetical protein
MSAQKGASSSFPGPRDAGAAFQLPIQSGRICPRYLRVLVPASRFSTVISLAFWQWVHLSTDRKSNPMIDSSSDPEKWIALNPHRWPSALVASQSSPSPGLLTVMRRSLLPAICTGVYSVHRDLGFCHPVLRRDRASNVSCRGHFCHP